MAMALAAADVEIPPVVKKKAGRPKGTANKGIGRSVRIDPKLAQMARVLAARKGMELGPYLSQLLSGPITKEYQAMVREMSKELGGGGGA
jgi:hypothetical protein